MNAQGLPVVKWSYTDGGVSVQALVRASFLCFLNCELSQIPSGSEATYAP